MTYKLLVAAALSLGLGTAAAMAQDTNQPATGDAAGAAADSQLPSGWDGAIGDAFFADSELGTLRSQEEVRTNWESLTDEQQAQVRAHCDTVDMAAAGTADDMTTSSTTPDTAHTASITQVCGWVDSM